MSKLVTITMDLEQAARRVGNGESLAPRVPAPGELVVTIGKRERLGSHYRIVAAREVNRRDGRAVPRFVLRCERVPWPSAKDLTPTWYMRWHARRRRVD